MVVEEVWNALPNDAETERYGGDPSIFSGQPMVSSSTIRHLSAEVYTDKYGAVAPRITGSISCVASVLIIYVIIVSPRCLKSIYHRVMFGMSVSDITKAVAMALTTLPMPKYSRATERYGFVGLRIGNVHTCNAQGFFMIFGAYTTYLYVGSLSVYYLCAIALSMPEPSIKKKIEPFLHGVPIVVGLASALPPLFLDMYNPNSGDAWCTIRRLPYWCKDDCVRGQPGYYDPLLMFTLATILVDFLVIIVCLSLVFRKVITQNRLLAEYNRLQYDTEDQGSVEYRNMLNLRHRTTRIVAVQSLSYVLGLVLTLLFTTLSLLNGLMSSRTFDPEARYLRLIFEPLQGFFNFLIFIYSKIVILRNADRSVSFCAILGQIFSGRRRETPAAVQNHVSDNVTGIEFSRDNEGKIVVDSFLDDEGLSYNPSSLESFASRPTNQKKDAPLAVPSSQVMSTGDTDPSPKEKEGQGQQNLILRRHGFTNLRK